MKLSKEIKNKIYLILDSDEFVDTLYLDRDGNYLNQEKRDQLGQFYTPGKVCIQMLEAF